MTTFDRKGVVTSLTPIRALYNGIQHFPNFPPIELWTIMEPMGEHPIHSTLSFTTISDAGYCPVEEDRS